MNQIINHLIMNTLVFVSTLSVLVASSRNHESDSLLSKSSAQLSDIIAVQQLNAEKQYMSSELSRACNSFLEKIQISFDSLSEHQKQLMFDHATFTGKVLSPNHNYRKYILVRKKFSKQLNYLRNTENIKNGFALLVNAIGDNRGGQRAYLVNMRDASILEIKISTAWKGIGYSPDSGRTPLGLFNVYSLFDEKSWEAQTMMGGALDIYRKIEKREWLDVSKSLKYNPDEKEKAYIVSNQFGLIGQNDGKKHIPIEAPKYLYNKDTSVYYINNSNSGLRQLYIHGTNRVEQLGFALSGGCVRVSSIFSYLLSEIISVQNTLPVFIDAVAFHSPRSRHRTPTFVANDLEDTYSFSFSFSFMYDSMFCEEGTPNFKKNLEHQLIQPLTKGFINDRNINAKLKIASALPLPETAMKDWYFQKDEIENLEHKTFRYNFDLDGKYIGNKFNVKSKNSSQFISQNESIDIISKRVETTKKYILHRLEEELSKFEINVEDLTSQIEIDFIPLKENQNQSESDSVGLGFCLSTERERVLYYLEYLDGLHQSKPFKILNRKDLKWLTPYLTQEGNLESINSEEGKKSEPMNIEDGFLAQAYIYAIGEMELRKRGVADGFLKNKNDETGYQNYKSTFDDDELMIKLDQLGQAELLRFSTSYESNIYGNLTPHMKQYGTWTLGIILTSEEYFSQYKKDSNKLHIISEISLNNKLLEE
ncbi:L,D-transpeptidase [Sediminitomix flava]|uniref:L,D-TPase catalytic domain-containing protein n=1 Tax=Sediminitomix flava TaxID=379075 RepID=A0A315ZAS8_SEDFL|nr:L,D-transpeptidase [Sediminitomix flava]PWJ41824.1 hypothetical protein BC781_10374 [Sediminitomix flava]